MRKGITLLPSIIAIIVMASIALVVTISQWSSNKEIENFQTIILNNREADIIIETKDYEIEAISKVGFYKGMKNGNLICKDGRVYQIEYYTGNNEFKIVENDRCYRLLSDRIIVG